MIHDTDVNADVQAALIDKGHASRGYDLGAYGSHTCYHFLIGKDGTTKQNRSLTERPYCTRNTEVNDAAIQVVLAGDFENEWPTAVQMQALKLLIARLDSVYHFERIMMHRDASPTACPGKNMVTVLDQWHLLRNNKMGTPYLISRYYTPIPGQTTYYHGSYEKDFQINCQGDCFKTADGFDLHGAAPLSIAACPPDMPLGTKLHIEGIGDVTCHDHGGAITGNRIDVWAGVGTDGLRTIATTKSGFLSVTPLSQ